MRFLLQGFLTWKFPDLQYRACLYDNCGDFLTSRSVNFLNPIFKHCCTLVIIYTVILEIFSRYLFSRI